MSGSLSCLHLNSITDKSEMSHLVFSHTLLNYISFKFCPNINKVPKILLRFLYELRLEGPNSQVVFVALLYEVILVYSTLHGLYLQSLTLS